jgi:hypothetical protein
MHGISMQMHIAVKQEKRKKFYYIDHIEYKPGLPGTAWDYFTIQL